MQRLAPHVVVMLLVTFASAGPASAAPRTVAVTSCSQVEVYDSTISGNAVAGILAKNIGVRRSTISGNGRVGVGTTATGRARINDSTVVDNDASVVCAPPTAIDCVDVLSARRPDVRNTTCKRSARFDGSHADSCAHGWCVCSEDGL